MRVWISLIVVACVACKKKPDSAPAVGSGAGSGSQAPLPGDAAPVPIDAVAAAVAVDGAVAAVVDAGPPPAPFCLDDEDEDRGYKQLASTDKTLTFCLRQEERTPKCATLDLAAGTFTTIAAPADLDVEKPTPPAKKLDTSTLELPKGHEWSTVTSPDGKTIAAISGDVQGQMLVVDAETKKVRKVVKWGADGGCMESPSFIGDNIYVQYNVCAGPGATGWIVSPEGKKLGSLKHVNPTGNFFPAGGTRYAFEDFTGSALEIVDGKTGKSVKEIEINVSTMDCPDCVSFRTGNLGLVPVPGGKLVQLMAKIAVIDPAAGKIEKLIPWPKCKAK